MVARSEPAQDGEHKAGKSDQSSQASVDDGEVAGVIVDCD